MRDVWRRGQEGWPRGYPLVQAPNAPLLIALAASLLTFADIGGSAGVWRVITTGAVLVWALLEIAAGANTFRRVLGTVVLVWVVIGLAGVR